MDPSSMPLVKVRCDNDNMELRKPKSQETLEAQNTLGVGSYFYAFLALVALKKVHGVGRTGIKTGKRYTVQGTR